MPLDLELRKTYLGGTDLTAISGLSDYTKPGDVWLEKMGQSTFTGNDDTEWGKDMEPVVAMRHGRRFGVNLLELPPEPVYHPEFAFIAANPDRIYVRRKRILECKTAAEEQLYGQDSPWGEDGEANKVPIGYLGQTNHYIGMLAFDDAYLSCMFLGRSRIHRDYPIAFDRELYDLMVSNGVTFWRTYVEPRIQPPVELFSPDVAMKAVALRARLEGKNEPPLEATPQVEEWARRYKTLSDSLKGDKAAKQILGARIAQWITENNGTKVKHSLGSFTFKKGEEKAAVPVTDFSEAFARFLAGVMTKVPPPLVDEISTLAAEIQEACTTTPPTDPTGPTLRPWWAK